MFDRGRREEALRRVQHLLAERDRAEAALVAALAEVQAASGFGLAGALSGHRFLRSSGGRTRPEAIGLLSVARLSGRYEATAAALAAGWLSPSHARVLAAAVTSRREPCFARDEDVLLDHAERLDIEAFEVLLRHWCELVDQDTAEPAAWPEQRLYVQQRFDGGSDLRGSLDAPTTLVVLAGLDHYDTGPDPTDGPIPPRSLAERRADALGDLAAHALGLDADADLPRTPVATANIVIDLVSLAGRDGTGDLEGLVATIGGRAVSIRAVETLLGTSWLGAILTGARDAVVHATERCAPFTTTQRRVLAVRDGGCAFPGCNRPPNWCDAHHLHHRAHDGRNHLDNAVALCRRHHRLLHTGWTLTRAPDSRGWHATNPTGTTWTGRPPPGPPPEQPPVAIPA